jgi:transglutaminase-like putative cysteine protease
MTTQPPTAEPVGHDLAGLLAPTAMLDHRNDAIRQLVTERGWRELEPDDRIGAVYNYVRNDIAFGYNTDDDISASEVLADGYGQCNTKATLLMALLRAVDIPCRLHAATINKRLQEGVVPAAVYRLAPDEILHAWVEVLVDNDWKRLEGVILDDAYLNGLRCQIGRPTSAFIGYAAGTDDLDNPPVEWVGDHTEIQMTGVERNLGIYADPDSYYQTAGTNLSGLKRILYRRLIRHIMNRTVREIRSAHRRQHSDASGDQP